MQYRQSSAFQKFYQNNIISPSNDCQNAKINLIYKSSNIEQFEKPTEESSRYLDSKLFYQFLKISKHLNDNLSFTMQLFQRNSKLESYLQTLENLIGNCCRSAVENKKIKILQQIYLNIDNLGDRLISHVFPHQTYKYQIIIDQGFDFTLYKDRNFDLNLKLVDSQSDIIKNCNPIPISMSFYTSEAQPQPIVPNKLQQSIIKGSPQNQIYHGKSEFKKIQLREVTSHYPNGWIYLIIYAKTPSFNFNHQQSNCKEIINYSEIKPLVLAGITVKSKKK